MHEKIRYLTSELFEVAYNKQIRQSNIIMTFFKMHYRLSHTILYPEMSINYSNLLCSVTVRVLGPQI